MSEVKDSQPEGNVSTEVADLLERHHRSARWRARLRSLVAPFAVISTCAIAAVVWIRSGPAQGIAAFIGFSLMWLRTQSALRNLDS